MREPDSGASLRLDRALEFLRHRGPDHSGKYVDAMVGLGHTRLSIIDLTSAGNQPMTSADGMHVISYNGELYNFRELAAKLGMQGLRTSSDTEVVLRALVDFGAGVLKDFRGIFAFALHDKGRRRILLGRDRLGVKPLYYFAGQELFAFASEIAALLCLLPETPGLARENLTEWSYFGNPLGDKTLFDGICRVSPGGLVAVDLDTGSIESKCYWTVGEAVARRRRWSGNSARHRERVAELLENAIRRQLVSDVPIGVFLSGGIDSSAIVAFAAKHSEGRLKTYSAGFDDPRFPDERIKAAKVARHFGTEHHEMYIQGSDVHKVVEDLILAHGMPFFDAANIPLYLLAKEVSKEVKVVLQGDGGDELFCGYNRYTMAALQGFLRIGAELAWRLGRGVGKNLWIQRLERHRKILGQRSPARFIALSHTGEVEGSDFLQAFCGPTKEAMANGRPFEFYDEVATRFFGCDAVQMMSAVDLLTILPDTYLEKVDRATMWHGVEVRVPFLDEDLVDYVINLSGWERSPLGSKKWLLKKALRGIVPDFVLDGPKVGFNVPFGSWITGSLREHFASHLKQFAGSNPDVIDEGCVERWMKESIAGIRDHTSRLWKIYNLVIWANLFDVRMGEA